MIIDKIYQIYRRVFVVCPCCDVGENVFRLSDAELIHSDRHEPRDWFSKISEKYDRECAKLGRLEEKFEMQKEKIIEENRRRAEILTDNAVKKVIPTFKRLKLNTRDLKSLFFPVRFVSFDGLSDRHVYKVRFLDVEPTSKTQEKIQNTLEKSIKSGNIEWKTIVVGEDGRVSEK